MTQCPVSLKTTIDTSDATSLTCCRDKFPFDFSPAITSNGILGFVCESCANCPPSSLADTSVVHGRYFLLEVSGVVVRGFFQIDVPFYYVSKAVPCFLGCHYCADLTFCYKSWGLDPYPVARFEFIHFITSGSWYSASENILLGIDSVYNILYTELEIPRPPCSRQCPPHLNRYFLLQFCQGAT